MARARRTRRGRRGKSQIPGSKSQRTPSSQVPKPTPNGLGNWPLGIPWDLELGIWDLSSGKRDDLEALRGSDRLHGVAAQHAKRRAIATWSNQRTLRRGAAATGPLTRLRVSAG